MLGFNKTENDRLESLFGELSQVKKVHDINFLNTNLKVNKVLKKILKVISILIVISSTAKF